MAMDEVKGRFRIELLELIAKYHPFPLAEVNSAFEALGSVDATIKAAEVARTEGITMHAVYERSLKKEAAID